MLQERVRLQRHVLVVRIGKCLIGCGRAIRTGVHRATLYVAPSRGAADGNTAGYGRLQTLLHRRRLPLVQVYTLVASREPNRVSAINLAKHKWILCGRTVFGEKRGHAVGGAKPLNVRVVGVVAASTKDEEVAAGAPLDVLLEGAVYIGASAHEDEPWVRCDRGIAIARADAPIGVVGSVQVDRCRGRGDAERKSACDAEHR